MQNVGFGTINIHALNWSSTWLKSRVVGYLKMETGDEVLSVSYRFLNLWNLVSQRDLGDNQLVPGKVSVEIEICMGLSTEKVAKVWKGRGEGKSVG